MKQKTTSHSAVAQVTPRGSISQSMESVLGHMLEAERPFLRRMAYRITGTTADAEDVVQESFAKVLTSPPPDLAAPLRPWLLRVTCNLAIDVLRKRKRRVYVGPWLPSPFAETEPEPASPSARYAAKESLTFAFLLALEALTPKQRAVLILRDVLDLDVRETAASLGVSESNAKVLHLRARQRLASYDHARIDTSALAQQRVAEALQKLLLAMASGQPEQVAALLAEDAVMQSDGGGRYVAARKPVVGARLLTTFLCHVARGFAPGELAVEGRELSGLPALCVRLLVPRPTLAPQSVLSLTINAEGKITAIYQVLHEDKLTDVLDRRLSGGN